MKTLTGLILFLFMSISMLSAQDKVFRYDIFEKTIIQADKFVISGSDVIPMARFTDFYNNQHFVNGFYDGNGIWKVRFSPDNPREWNYAIEFAGDDSIYTGSFNCREGIAPVEPVQVNLQNPRWIKRTVHPFFVKGIRIDWEVLINNDTAQWQQLKASGCNLLYLDNTDSKGINLLPGNYADYQKLENSLSWIRKNEFVIVLPVYLFPPDHKPADINNWNWYISNLYARLGAFQNILFYIPDSFDSHPISREEKDLVVSAIMANNRYDSPFGFLNDNERKLVNRYLQFELCTSPMNQVRKQIDEPIIPLVHIVPGNISRDQSTLIPYLSGAFIEGYSCILDNAPGLDGSSSVSRELWSFFESVPYFDMEPAPEITDDAACMGVVNSEYILLVEDRKQLQLNLGDNYYRALWINPYNVSLKPDARIVSGMSSMEVPAGSDIWFLQLNKRMSGFPMGIHLSWSEKPESSITVTWYTVSQGNPCTLMYRKKGILTWNEKTGVSEKSSGPAWIHSVVINQLEPGTDYEYKVSADSVLNGVFSPVYKTSTAPAGDTASFTFSFITDTGIEGRLDNNATGTSRIIHELLLEKPGFLLGGGDYAYANRDKRFKTTPDAITAWFDQYQPVLSSIPLMAQYGNHELYLQEKFTDWAPFFKHPEGSSDNRHYSFDIGNIHFAAFCLVDYVPSREDLEWLDRDLQKARLNNKWIIVYHHEPLYAHGTSHPSKAEITEAVYPLLSKYEVDLDINAHDQNYERTYPLSGTDPLNPSFSHAGGNVYHKGEGTVFMKVSPAGKKSEIGNMFPLLKETKPLFMAKQNRTSHHLPVFRVLSGESIEASVYAVPEDGSPKYLIDYFIISEAK